MACQCALSYNVREYGSCLAPRMRPRQGPDRHRPSAEAKVGALEIRADAYREDARGAYRVDACLGVLESDAILYPRRQKLGRVKEDLRVGLGHGQRAGVDYRVEESGYAQADEDLARVPARRGEGDGEAPSP